MDELLQMDLDAFKALKNRNGNLSKSSDPSGGKE